MDNFYDRELEELEASLLEAGRDVRMSPQLRQSTLKAIAAGTAIAGGSMTGSAAGSGGSAGSAQPSANALGASSGATQTTSLGALLLSKKAALLGLTLVVGAAGLVGTAGLVGETATARAPEQHAQREGAPPSVDAHAARGSSAALDSGAALDSTAAPDSGAALNSTAALDSGAAQDSSAARGPDAQVPSTSQKRAGAVQSGVVQSAAVQSGARVAGAGEQADQSLSAELAQLARVRAALNSGQAQQALTLLRAYKQQFTAPQLALEAAVLQIESYAKSGQTSRAEKLAKSFIAQHPQSPLNQRVRKYLASGN